MEDCIGWRDKISQEEINIVCLLKMLHSSVFPSPVLSAKKLSRLSCFCYSFSDDGLVSRRNCRTSNYLGLPSLIQTVLRLH